MEKTIFIATIENLKFVDSGYSRLYFGNEFCERLIPSKDDLRYVLDFVLERKMDFTLVTPFVTNAGLAQLEPLMDFLSDQSIPIEIVINDWGVLRRVRQKFSSFNLALGRLLTKQKRGPRILNLLDKIPFSAAQHFKESNIDSPHICKFLTDIGIRRVELDNLLQGISRPEFSLTGSLYIPFAYITTTRFCPVNSLSQNSHRSLRTITPCKKQCQRYAFRLSHKQMPVDLILKGNTQFFKNDKYPEDLEKLNIDRIVYQPELPF